MHLACVRVTAHLVGRCNFSKDPQFVEKVQNMEGVVPEPAEQCGGSLPG